MDPAASASGWAGTVGAVPTIGPPHRERALWPVRGEDGRQWFLKDLGPWRNLPIASEAAVLDHLAVSGVTVAPFVLTDAGSTTSGSSFVLMPRIEAVDLPPGTIDRSADRVGRSVALLHRALAANAHPTGSYTERIGAALCGDLALPEDVRAAFGRRRERIAARLEALPKSLVHGDLTPDNVLRSADGGVSGFIDFDHLPLAPRVWDVAKYLSRRVRARWRGGHGERTAGWADLVRGYESVEPLTPEERACLPDAVLAYNVLEVDHARSVAEGRLQRRMLSDHLDVLADAEDAVRWQLRADPAR